MILQTFQTVYLVHNERSRPSNVYDRSPFLNVQRFRPFLILKTSQTFKNGQKPQGKFDPGRGYTLELIVQNVHVHVHSSKMKELLDLYVEEL